MVESSVTSRNSDRFRHIELTDLDLSVEARVAIGRVIDDRRPTGIRLVRDHRLQLDADTQRGAMPALGARRHPRLAANRERAVRDTVEGAVPRIVQVANDAVLQELVLGLGRIMAVDEDREDLAERAERARLTARIARRQERADDAVRIARDPSDAIALRVLRRDAPAEEVHGRHAVSEEGCADDLEGIHPRELGRCRRRAHATAASLNESFKRFASAAWMAAAMRGVIALAPCFL